MKAFYKFYLKTMLIFTVPLFLAMVPFQILLYKLSFPILNDSYSLFMCKGGLLLAVVLGGAFFSLILGTLHISAVKQIKDDISEEDIQAKQTREIELPHAFGIVYSFCMLALEKLDNSKTIEGKKELGIIIAKTKWGWNTFGDKIKIVLTSINDKETRVEIQSKSLVNSPVDYGSNLKNVETLKNYLASFITPSMANE